MKIVVTYEAADIVRLIRTDLAAQGIVANEGDIKFVKNKAIVSVEVAKDDAPPEPPEPPEMLANTSPPKQAPPHLEPIEGAANPVDMTEILRASQKTATQNPGRFPTPERQLMDGESYEYPGDKR